ncbi:MAG TPA: c-type cytochrome biogenesis protein CcmI [Xanthobacteraceae bacterium]|jgi:cytochrome c-type biogenesis protein CcmH|nr:c-type cytochrome biogenesis protein CcmI [Xanthobacteraceae bacterium]
MTMWLLFVFMTAAAIFAVLWPLSRKPVLGRSGSDLAVYEDQIQEIARDRAAGLIAEGEAAAAHIEVSRRLLAAADAAAVEKDWKTRFPSSWRRRAAGIVALVILPAISASLYLVLGSPRLEDYPLAARLETNPETRSIEGMLAQVETHLDRNPEDGAGWQVIAPVYMRLGRFDDAVKARRNALRILGATAERESDLGEALVAAANGMVTIDAKQAFNRALVKDPKFAKAKFFMGLSFEQDGKREEAVAIWRNLIKESPPAAPWVAYVKEQLARLDGKQPEAANGPSSDDIAAAGNLTPQEQSAMVRGMVERLAERLRQQGDDIEGWLRLVQAYTVLGERDKAIAAAADARRALAAYPDRMQRIDDLVRNLRLGS